MPRSPKVEKCERERLQEVFGNIDHGKLDADEKLTFELAYAFRRGVERMADIIKGKDEGNDSAAVSAFRAVADVYQAKKRLDDARARGLEKIASVRASTEGEKKALTDVLRQFSQEEIKAALKQRSLLPSPDLHVPALKGL